MPRQSSLASSAFLLREGKVVLRPFTRRELMSTEYLRWMNDANVTKTIGRFDYLMPVSRAKLVQYFNDIDTDTTMFLAIDYVGKFSGTLKIYDLEPFAQRASLGIMVRPEMWGRGIATTAIRAACTYIFEVLGFRKITAGYIASNVAMRKPFEKNGFKVEGVLRKHLVVAGKLDDHVFVGKFR